MTLSKTLKDVLNYRRTAVIVLLSVLLISVIVTLSLPKKYAATITLYVYSRSDSANLTAAYQGSLLSEQRVSSYATLFVSNRVGQSVKRALGLPQAPEDITKEISVSAEPESVLLKATVTDRSQLEAVAIANAAADAFVGLVADIEKPTDVNSTPAVAVRIVEEAVPSVEPVSPSWLLNLTLGLASGIVLAVISCSFRSSRDQTIKRSTQLSETVDSPIVGVISLDESSIDTTLILSRTSFSGRTEEFKRLRSNLAFLSVDERKRSIVITSTVAGEGKTTVACNLALMAAKAGHRTILIDADLRRPRVASALGVESQVGLTTILTGRLSLSSALTSIGGLDVLASGVTPPNPSELVGSKNMSELIENLNESYDLIVIDSPPLLPVTDAALLGRSADGVILICGSGKVRPEQVRVVVDDLSKAKIRVLGTVLNMAPPTEPSLSSSYDSYAPVASTDSFAAPERQETSRRGRRTREDRPGRPGRTSERENSVQ